MPSVKSDYRVIELTKGCVAIISAQDYRRVNRHKWYTHQSAGSKRGPGYPYARACINGKKVYLHRFIMDAGPDVEVDHKNHQTLDCRRPNLECVTPSENKLRKRARRKTKI